jgi:hypothetical protein
MADVRCPICGKMNPEDAEICQYCFAQLKEEEQPDWLSRIRERSKQEQENDTDLPDWLRDETTPVNPKAGQGEQPQSEPENAPAQSEPGISSAAAGPTGPQGGSGDAEVPEWLQKLRSQPEEEANPLEDQGTLPPAGEMTDLPDWLKELTTPPAVPSEPGVSNKEKVETVSEPPAGEPSAPPQPPQDQPVPEKSSSWESWPLAIDANLEEITPSASQNIQPAAEEISPAPVETPQWLSGISTGEPTPPAPASGQPPSENESSAPDWLASLESDLSAGKPKEDRPAPFDPETTPDWLARLQAEENAPTSPAAGTPSLVFTEDASLQASHEETRPFSLEDLPDWLARMSPPEEGIVGETSEAQPAREKEKEEEITLAPAELPSWVQAMRPIETAMPEPPAPPEEDERVEKTGPLAGLRGILPVEPLVSEVRKPPAYPVNLQVSEKQRINAALFESILSSEIQPQAAPRDRSFPSQRVLRILIAVVLIVAVWLPIWQGSQEMSLPGYLPAEISAIQSTINNLAPGSTVLLAVDYEPALAGEVGAVASSVVAHLMSKSADIILISTNPMGPVLAEQLLNNAQKSQPGYDISANTLNLGYLAGGPSGLFNFAIQPQLTTPLTVDGKNAWEQPLLKDKSLSNFAGVFVVTESADTARTWVEQVKPVLGSVPLFMITSAQVAPLIRPYYDANQVQGFVSGLTGGAIYEQSSAVPGVSRNYWDSYQAGILIAVALVSIGGLIAVGNVLFTRRKPREEE